MKRCSQLQKTKLRARLIAVAAPHSGNFLNAILCYPLGTRLNYTSLRIAISLRLGATMCAPHTCICGMQVDSNQSREPFRAIFRRCGERD